MSSPNTTPPVTNGNGSSAPEPTARASSVRARRRTPWPLVVVATLFVVVPFLAWYGTWFGRALSDEQLDAYIREDKPRHLQHALVEIEKRIVLHDASARRWYAQVMTLAAHPSADVRQTAAWVMGADAADGDFHDALVRLLDDEEPVVRANAALSLVSVGDARARPVLLEMLRPYTVRAPLSGTLLTALDAGARVKREAMLARLATGAGETSEVRAPLPGKVARTFVREGEQLERGRELVVLDPEPAQVRDALIGLSFVGTAEDVPEIERDTAGEASDELRREAERAVATIRRRSEERP